MTRLDHQRRGVRSPINSTNNLHDQNSSSDLTTTMDTLNFADDEQRRSIESAKCEVFRRMVAMILHNLKTAQ